MEADESQLQGILGGNNSPKTAERGCWAREMAVACVGEKVRCPGGHRARLTGSGLGGQKEPDVLPASFPCKRRIFSHFSLRTLDEEAHVNLDLARSLFPLA